MKRLLFLSLMFLLVAKGQAQITVSSNNYVGIGTSSPSEALEVNGNIKGNQACGALKINSTAPGYLILGPQGWGYCHLYTDRPCFMFNQTVCSLNGDFGSFNSSDLILKTGVVYTNKNGVTRMTIKNSNGYVGIGTTNPSYLLDVNGVIRVATTTYQSDARLKDNIKDMTGALTSLVNLKGVTYNFKAPETSSITANTKSSLLATSKSALSSKTDTSRTEIVTQEIDSTLYNRKHIGFVAQDVQKIFPELVYSDKNGTLSVDYVSLIPVLVESIKDQQTAINELKATLKELKKKMNSK